MRPCPSPASNGDPAVAGLGLLQQVCPPYTALRVGHGGSGQEAHGLASGLQDSIPNP